MSLPYGENLTENVELRKRIKEIENELKHSKERNYEDSKIIKDLNEEKNNLIQEIQRLNEKVVKKNEEMQKTTDGLLETNKKIQQEKEQIQRENENFNKEVKRLTEEEQISILKIKQLNQKLEEEIGLHKNCPFKRLSKFFNTWLFK